MIKSFLSCYFVSLWRKRYTHRKGEICNAVEMRMLEFFAYFIKKILVSISLKLFFPHVIPFLTIVWHNNGYGVSSVIHFPIFILINM